MSVRIKLDLFFKSANGVKCGKIISVMAPSEPTLKAFRFESPGMSAAKYFTLVKDFCPDYRRLKIWGVHFFFVTDWKRVLRPLKETLPLSSGH